MCHDGKKHNGHNAMKHKHANHKNGIFSIEEGTNLFERLDDELLEVECWQDTRINGLEFKTYKGKHHFFGHKEGEHKSIKYNGCTFGAVKGGYAEHLDFLVFQIHPLPEKHKDLKPKH